MSNLEELLREQIGEPTDDGLLKAMTWLADGLAADAMPLVAVAAFAGLVQEARRRGLVEAVER
jgi:hypothetical protein